jgi:uncharacterized repeat protein (TIGR01451 family)
VGAGGASCPASGSGDINASGNLPVGGTATFTATGTLSAAATGTLVNTATATAPGGVTDPTPGNNSATDTDTLTPQPDLAITRTSAPNPYVAGAPLTYTVVATNAGPSDVVGATVLDTLAAPLSGFAWTCVAAGGATCGAPSGSCDINVLVALPVGASTTFAITGTVPGRRTAAAADVPRHPPPPGGC